MTAHTHAVGDIVWTMPDYPTRDAERFVVVKLLPTGYALQGGPGHVRVDFAGRSACARKFWRKRHCTGWASPEIAAASEREIYRRQLADRIVPMFTRGLWRGLTTEQLERIAAIVEVSP